MGGGLAVGGRIGNLSQMLVDGPRRDIGLKPRSEWTDGSSKGRKAAEKPKVELPKVVEHPKVEFAAEIAREVKEDERKATGDLGDALEYAASVEPKADGMHDCPKPIEEVTAEEAAEIESKIERPKVELTETEIEPQTEQPAMAVPPELPKFGEGGKRKKRRRRRRH